MKKIEMIDKCKRFIKNRMPFALRHQLQLYISNHPDCRMTDYFRQDFIMERYHACFNHMIHFIGEIDMSGKSICELGPGGSPSNAFYLFQLGGRTHTLLDICDFIHAERQLSRKEYQEFVLPSTYRKKQELPPFREGTSLSSYMKEINVAYYPDGLDGYKRVPDESVDFLYSCTVLQHIRKNIFMESVREMYRVMKPGAIAFHMVDLKDMMGGKKNHLRYSDEYWNDEAHRNMRCYTNRIQCGDMCEIFKEAGFKLKKLERTCFKKAPIKEKLLDRKFQQLSKKELYTETFSIMMEK